jgi:hypothetical protein
MSSNPIQQWHCLDCGVSSEDIETMQTHLKEQHNYDDPSVPERDHNILVAVIASHIHDDDCAWQIDPENRLYQDCECVGWECGISGVYLPDGRATLEEHLEVLHNIDINEASSRIFEDTTEEIVRRVANLVPYFTPASSPACIGECEED